MMAIIVAIIIASFITIVAISVITVLCSLTLNIAFDYPEWGWLEWIDDYLIPGLARGIVLGGGLLIICLIISLIKMIMS